MSVVNLTEHRCAADGVEKEMIEKVADGLRFLLLQEELYYAES